MWRILNGHDGKTRLDKHQEASIPRNSQINWKQSPAFSFRLRSVASEFQRFLLCVCSPLQDVLYTICNNCGPVQRIVIFRKNGVQAMVEYPFCWGKPGCDLNRVYLVKYRGGSRVTGEHVDWDTITERTAMTVQSLKVSFSQAETVIGWMMKGRKSTGSGNWSAVASLTVATFDSVQSAQRAKASLNGADIYSGCCTLKIEYAKVWQDSVQLDLNNV